MSTPKETTPPFTPIPAESYSAITPPVAAAPLAPVEPDPDNPPWNILTGVLTWIASVLILFGMGLLSGLLSIFYLMFRYGKWQNEELQNMFMKDPVAILINVLALIPAHLATLGVAWWIVTDRGKRPFWRSLGWSYNRGIGFWASTMIALLLLAFGWALTEYYKGAPTDIDQIINSSTAARLVMAFMATVTAPLVEEVIYRGILFPALQRAIGTAWAVVGVTILFLAVHVPQYYNNISVIAAIGVLSLVLTLVRAYTGRLLPCFIIHLVFNGVQSLAIVFAPYLTQPESAPEQKTGAVVALAQTIAQSFTQALA